VKTLVQNPVFRFLSDLRLGAVLLVILAVTTGAATLIESHYAGLGSSQTGRAAAYDLVYDAPWFNALLIVLFVNVALNLVRRMQRGHYALGFLLVHVGILVILVGAGITRWFGFEGYLHIREGQANNVVSSADMYARVRLGETEAEMPVRLYRPGAQSLSREVTLEGRTITLGVAEYWPRFERVMVPGEGGFAQIVVSVMEDGGLRQHTLREGDEHPLAGVPVRFHRDGMPPLETMDAPYGLLRVRAGGQVCRLPIVPEPTVLGSCGGWTFELSDFDPDYHGHGQADHDHDHGADDPAGALKNPMVRVVVSDPTGKSATRTLFALHPEFALAHENHEFLRQVDMLYELGGGIDLAKVDGQIVIRASFPLELAAMGAGGESRVLPAGEVAPLQVRTVYRGERGLSLVPTSIEPSLVSTATRSRDPNAPAAARLFIAKNGQRVDAICERGRAPQRVELGGDTYWLAYGSVMRTLPYNLFLQEFRLETYPGSENPASYESHVLLNDPGHGIEGRPVRIWMNNPLNHRGTKHFQSSYDRDRLGTVLSINRDPGKIPTYIGYTIFSLGFVLVMGKSLGSGSRRRANGAAMAGLLVCLGWLLPGEALAQHGMGGRQHQQGPPPTLQLSPEARDLAARMVVQDWRGRMKPLDTLARETSIKITRKAVFEGHDPVELFLAFAVLPSDWYHHPAIAVTNPGVKDLLGISHDQTHIALASVVPGGRYKLQNDVEVAHRTAPGQRSKTQQQLIRFDERVHLMYSALLGTSLRIFPIPDDPNDKWAGIQTVLEGLPEGDPRRAEFQTAADALFMGLEAGNQEQIIAGLRATTDLQRRYGKGVKPSKFQIDSELMLNRLKPFQRATLPYLAGFVLLITAYFIHLFRRNEQLWTLRQPLYALGMLLFVGGFVLHIYGFTLRWIASARAPLSNGHESLLWVALAVGLAGLIFELKSRTGASGALGSLLAAAVLGVSMLGAFDPAIGPLVPVLASYWLIIHVTVITASYGFFALCCLLGLLTLVLLIIAGLNRRPVTTAVAKLDRLNVDSMMAGLGLLAVGTLLGGVWANESWGRYWGWDPKETWALVSILVYAMILHFRWIPRFSNPFVHAVWSFMAIWVIIMTYFGVNYLLVGLHSYAAGDAATVPTWVVISFMVMLAFSLVGYFAWRDPETRRLTYSELASTPGSP
jgi:cytochrome c-type biogenesis protein CcsB